MLMEFHIGIDDTDSRTSGCTTYTATLLYQELIDGGFRPTDFPWLVRLNPNIPWKTRGNGALAIHLAVEEAELDSVREIAIHIVEKTSDVSKPSTDPALVFLEGPVPEILRKYSTRALHDVISVTEAKSLARTVGASTHLLKGARGLIGSLAAISAGLDMQDHTFEIIAYRTRENLGTSRRVNRDSIRKMDEKYSNSTFNNVDPETGRILICPHGPDPVLLGIRGSDPRSVLEAFREVKIHEPVETVMIFKTNQGTDAHLTKARRIADLEPHQSTALTGRVETVPRVLKGGHVVFRLGDETGFIDCAVYEPTGSLKMTARQLLPGDRVRVYGGIRRRANRSLTLNLERLDVVGLAEAFHQENPCCPDCGGRCESMGRGQGFRCKKCRLRLPNASKHRLLLERNLTPAIFIPPPRARRHLTRPHSRTSSAPKAEGLIGKFAH